MGIDTTIKSQLFVLKKEWQKAKGSRFLDAWKKECEKNSELEYYWGDIDIYLDNDSVTFELVEGVAKRYSHEIFGEAISKYLSSGFLEMETQGELWGMRFDNGSWDEETPYIFWQYDAYEEFMRTYDKELTDELKEKLKLWKGVIEL